MHELAIAQGIIEICERHAAGRPVKLVRLEIGDLSGIVPDAIEFCFEACSQGTLLEGARVEIVNVAGQGRCQTCQAEVPLQTLFDTCPQCGSYHITVIAGQEMRVREIEVE